MNNKSNAAILDFDDIFGMALPVEKSKSKQTSKHRMVSHLHCLVNLLLCNLSCVE